MVRTALRQAPFDPVLANLPDLFPARGAPAFVSRAARAATGVEVDAEQGEVCFVRYDPGRSCSVLWSFAGADGRRVLISGRQFADARGGRIPEQPGVLRRMKQVMEASALRQRPCHFLRERRLLLQAFPMDLRLPGLARAGSEDWIHERLLPRLGPGPVAARRVKVEVRSYKPWERCVLRYRLAEDGTQADYFAKLLGHQQGAAVVDTLQALRSQLRATGGPWEIAAPFLHLAQERMVVASAFDEETKLPRWLRPARKREGVRTRLLEQIARAAEGLHVFQQTSPGPLRQVAPHELIAELRRYTGRIRLVAAELAARMEKALGALAAAGARLAPEPLVPTHGAFRLDHLVPCADKVGVLDLDTLCRSGRSADAGNFLAYLDALAERRPRLASVLRDCESAFSEALSPGSGERRAWLCWYRCASLVKIAIRCPLLLAPDWCASSHALLARAEERLAQLEC